MEIENGGISGPIAFPILLFRFSGVVELTFVITRINALEGVRHSTNRSLLDGMFSKSPLSTKTVKWTIFE